MKWNEIQDLFPETDKEDWKELECGAWIHKDAAISGAAIIAGPCLIRGGRFDGGIFHGGYFYDGYFDGGYFDGGTFHGGTFHGGRFYDGVFRETPFQLLGYLPFTVNISGSDTVQVGCENHTLEWWEDHWDEVCDDNRVDKGKALKVLNMLRDAKFPEPAEKDKESD